MNYIEAKNILDNKHGDKNRKKLANNTYLIRQADYIAVLLHNTEIVKLYPNYMTLHTGGWHTMTTKARINDYATTGKLTQEASLWYIGSELFYEGIKLNYNVTIISPLKESGKKLKEVKQIKAK